MTLFQIPCNFSSFSTCHNGIHITYAASRVSYVIVLLEWCQIPHYIAGHTLLQSNIRNFSIGKTLHHKTSSRNYQNNNFRYWNSYNMLTPRCMLKEEKYHTRQIPISHNYDILNIKYE